VSESFGLFGGQKEVVSGQVVDGGQPVSGGKVTVTDAGASQSVGVDSSGHFQATFFFHLPQELGTAPPHAITALYGGATVGTTTFSTSTGSISSAHHFYNLVLQLWLDHYLLVKLGVI
jgi:hypothetical protein